VAGAPRCPCKEAHKEVSAGGPAPAVNQPSNPLTGAHLPRSSLSDKISSTRMLRVPSAI
jgi:hypothetical protein